MADITAYVTIGHMEHSFHDTYTGARYLFDGCETCEHLADHPDELPLHIRDWLICTGTLRAVGELLWVDISQTEAHAIRTLWRSNGWLDFEKHPCPICGEATDSTRHVQAAHPNRWVRRVADLPQS